MTSIDELDRAAMRASRAEPRAFSGVFERHFDELRRYLVRRVGSALGERARERERILDPRTGRLLGELKTNLVDRQDMPKGTVVESVSYVRSGVVDSTSETPIP